MGWIGINFKRYPGGEFSVILELSLFCMDLPFPPHGE